MRKDDYGLEGLQTHVAMSAFGFSDYLETITVVDEDVDILDMAGGLVGCDNPLYPSEQVHIIPEVKAHRNNPIAGWGSFWTEVSWASRR